MNLLRVVTQPFIIQVAFFNYVVLVAGVYCSSVVIFHYLLCRQYSQNQVKITVTVYWLWNQCMQLQALF